MIRTKLCNKKHDSFFFYAYMWVHAFFFPQYLCTRIIESKKKKQHKETRYKKKTIIKSVGESI